jgi:hypothetical protein
MSGAFPQTLETITNAITMQISQVTCGRSFSKMKLLRIIFEIQWKISVCDLTVMTIERDFERSYERVIDKFSSNHKNCRILLLSVVYLYEDPVKKYQITGDFSRL